MSGTNGPKKHTQTYAISPKQMMMRRIIRQEDYFVCGICRSRHSSQAHATSCLAICWRSLLERAPWVVETRGIGRQPYACAYCQRGYPSPEQAHSCAQDCVNKLNSSAASENISSRQKITRSFNKPNSKTMARLEFQKLIARRKQADARIESERLEANERAINSGKSLEKHEEKAAVAPDVRTEHVCAQCKTPYPSKAEADACFSRHGSQVSGSKT